MSTDYRANVCNQLRLSTVFFLDNSAKLLGLLNAVAVRNIYNFVSLVVGKLAVFLRKGRD